MSELLTKGREIYVVLAWGALHKGVVTRAWVNKSQLSVDGRPVYLRTQGRKNQVGVTVWDAPYDGYTRSGNIAYDNEEFAQSVARTRRLENKRHTFSQWILREAALSELEQIDALYEARIK